MASVSVDALLPIVALVLGTVLVVIGMAWFTGVNGHLPMQTCIILAVATGAAAVVTRYPLGALPAAGLGALALHTAAERRIRHWIQDACQAVFASFHRHQRPRTTEEIMVDAKVSRWEVGVGLYLLLRSGVIETTDGEEADVHASLYRLPVPRGHLWEGPTEGGGGGWGSFTSRPWDVDPTTIKTKVCTSCNAEVFDHGLPRCETCHLVLPPPGTERCDVCHTVLPKKPYIRGFV